MKYPLIFILGLLFLASCRQTEKENSNKTVKKDSDNVKAPMPLTDSSKLLRHLDSLSQVKFPYESDLQYRQSTEINLSEFKTKELFKIPFKLIPTTLGGGLIDYGADQGEDTTFNLTDNNYKAQWKLIAKTPKFIVIEPDQSMLVTLTYQMEVIDAIHWAATDGNSHWSIERTSIINEDLTIMLKHYWSVQTDEKGNVDTDSEDEKWYIDQSGHFRKSEHQ